MAREIRELTEAVAVPRKNGELVFDAPWQSRAFGLAVGLCQKGFFHWDEFRERLIAEIAAHPTDGAAGARPLVRAGSEMTTDRDSPATVYYRQWLTALEKLLLDKGLLAKADLDRRAAELESGEEPR